MNVLNLGLTGLGVVVGAGVALYAVHRMPALTGGAGPAGGPPLRTPVRRDPQEWIRLLDATGDLTEGATDA